MLLNLDKNLEVSWVPPQQIGAAIQIFGYYLLRGLKAADTELSELTEGFIDGTTFLGIAYEIAPFRPLGCWASDVRILDDGCRYVTVYALSGEKLPRWVNEVDRLTVDWARANGCESVRFFGRAAYRSLIEDLNVIGQSEDGRALLFEKRVA